MIIVSSAPESEQIAANEIYKINPSAKFIKRISHGVCLYDVNIDTFFKSAQIKPPIFIRHIMPVDLVLKLPDYAENSPQLLSPPLNGHSGFNFNTSFSPVFERLTSLPFSVQTRIFCRNSALLTPLLVNNDISEFLENSGNILDVKNPQQIISVIITDTDIYAGLSSPEFNMSKWSGGAPMYSKTEPFISRAEFKLTEAMEVFGVSFKKESSALDLGAAPGGWSKILINAGLKVTSVDPAILSEALAGKVTHVKATAQQFFRNISERECKFDVITNDMKIDYNEAIDILFEAEKFLSGKGIIITTFKLPEKNQQKTAYKAVEILAGKYDVKGARRLFHNRSEVCVVLNKKQ
ncbi:MAG: hypothetical protein LBS21_14760 [Clostridiales bacterium]|jgi:23S rRNA (cytidine2498-2'-O)-methyltransferase|nr:hypothetical protein [Clostridiales bacterium]